MSASDDRPSHPPTRRHLAVLGMAVVGLVIGITLVITGRNATAPPTSTTPTSGPSAPHQPLLTSLGAVKDKAVATELMQSLDPHTLQPGRKDGATVIPSTAPPTTEKGVDASLSGVQRCQQAVAQQTTDRSLGDRLVARRLEVGRTTTFVVSYDLPPSGTTKTGTRIVLVDARTCRVLVAVDR